MDTSRERERESERASERASEKGAEREREREREKTSGRDAETLGECEQERSKQQKHNDVDVVQEGIARCIGGCVLWRVQDLMSQTVNLPGAFSLRV